MTRETKRTYFNEKILLNQVNPAHSAKKKRLMEIVSTTICRLRSRYEITSINGNFS